MCGPLVWLFDHDATGRTLCASYITMRGTSLCVHDRIDREHASFESIDRKTQNIAKL